MHSSIDTRLLMAAIVLAEELHYGHAAQKLHIAVSTLSKQIAQLEDRLGFTLFVRNSKGVDLTDAGRAYVEEARASMLHAEKAVNVARAANDGREHIIAAGHSPYMDQTLTLLFLSIHLPLYPRIKVQLHSDFSFELIHSVMSAEINMALVAQPPDSSALTLSEISEEPLYAVLPSGHPCEALPEVPLKALAEDNWVLFLRRLHPLLYDSILQTAKEAGVTPRGIHYIVTPEEAANLVKEHAGVAFLAKPVAESNEQPGITIRPLADRALRIKTYLALRANEPSRMVNEFARAFLRKCKPQEPVERQLRLPIK
ncbi:MAG: LysR family transcriptional regulator [Acidobacteria bacterium]|nr:LysR family transcriptional regulator [Acidobacteriota bacterium]